MSVAAAGADWPWPPRGGRLLPLLEVVGVYAWFHLCVWVVLPAVDRKLGPPVALAVLALLVLLSHRTHGDSAARVGFRRDTFLPCLRAAALVCGPFALFLLLLGVVYGPSRTWLGWLLSCLKYPLWGLYQQWIFQGFAHNRLLEATGRPRLAAFGAALLFALAHLPNPHLTIACCFGGALFSLLYGKYRNLPAIALWHGIVGASFLHVAPRWLMPTLKIGPGAWP
ncbi:MAG: CPBP family intramembrane metalloprotease [Planctomycetes bacterium]|nr:CPBP family intramembrane metalloprotease [Planctomycetota bacterium]